MGLKTQNKIAVQQRNRRRKARAALRKAGKKLEDFFIGKTWVGPRKKIED